MRQEGTRRPHHECGSLVFTKSHDDFLPLGMAVEEIVNQTTVRDKITKIALFHFPSESLDYAWEGAFRRGLNICECGIQSQMLSLAV